MKRLLIAAALTFVAGLAQAATVIPSSYTSTPGEGQAQGGSYNYFDDGGSQLTDGIRGADNWSADLGNGNAQEWVGWRFANPLMTFQFADVVTLTSMTIGLNRAEGAGIYTEISGNAGGTLFNIPRTFIADGTRGDYLLTFGVPFVGSSLTLSLADTGSGRWIFVDEVTFNTQNGTAVVPVPGALALMLPGLGLLGLAARRRRAGAA